MQYRPIWYRLTLLLLAIALILVIGLLTWIIDNWILRFIIVISWIALVNGLVKHLEKKWKQDLPYPITGEGNSIQQAPKWRRPLLLFIGVISLGANLVAIILVDDPRLGLAIGFIFVAIGALAMGLVEKKWKHDK